VEAVRGTVYALLVGSDRSFSAAVPPDVWKVSDFPFWPEAAPHRGRNPHFAGSIYYRKGSTFPHIEWHSPPNFAITK